MLRAVEQSETTDCRTVSSNNRTGLSRAAACGLDQCLKHEYIPTDRRAEHTARPGHSPWRMLGIRTACADKVRIPRPTDSSYGLSKYSVGRRPPFDNDWWSSTVRCCDTSARQR